MSVETEGFEHGEGDASRRYQAHPSSRRCRLWNVPWPMMKSGTAAKRSTDARQIAGPLLDGAYNLARWLVQSADMAETVVQTAALQALHGKALRPSSDARIELLRAVHDVARHRIAGCLQSEAGSRGSAVEAPSIDLTAAGTAPESRAVSAGLPTDLCQLHRAVAELPIDQRACLILREQELLSYGEIAQITQMSVDTVARTLASARETLSNAASQGGSGLDMDKPSASLSVP